MGLRSLIRAKTARLPKQEFLYHKWAQSKHSKKNTVFGDENPRG